MTDGELEVTHKTCTQCQQLKLLSDFSRQSDGPYGRRCACKACRKSSDREYHERNTGRRKIYRRGYYEQNKEKIVARQREKYKDCYQQQRSELQYILRALLSKAKKRAKKASLPFDLTLEWLETMVISHCPITLQPIDWLKEEVANGMPGPNSPSIDKNKPELGYVQTNCAIVSYRGNMIKSNGTIDEHRRVVQYMAAQQLRDTEF